MIIPKRVTVNPTLNESENIQTTQAVIPEIPAAGFPITLYIGGSVVGLTDFDIDGLVLSVDGDFSHLQWEINYYRGQIIKPKRVEVSPTYHTHNDQTHYILSEVPHSDFPVSFFLGGQVVGLADYHVENELITLEGDWTHLKAEAEYYAHTSDTKADMKAYLDSLKKGFTEPTGNTQSPTTPSGSFGQAGTTEALINKLVHAVTPKPVVVVVPVGAGGMLDGFYQLIEGGSHEPL